MLHKTLTLLIFLLLEISNISQAQIYADFVTTNGNFTAELRYDLVPKTVANFISLADGSRCFLSSKTGLVKQGPFYSGIKFHRVVNDPSFKIVQAGSQKGDGSDGPGYEILDEFNAALTHTPYVISMANSGPNSGGSQFFITGNVTISSLDNKHAVFGSIPDTASRAVIDAILTAGSNNTTITSVTIRRVGTAANAFNALAQNLPSVEGLPGNLHVTKNVITRWDIAAPTGLGSSTFLKVYRGTDLITFPDILTFYRSQDDTSLMTNLTFDNADVNRRFYCISQAKYFPALAPSSFVNRTLTMAINTSTLTYTFNATGLAGTATYTTAGGSTTTGSFSVYANSDNYHAYNVDFISSFSYPLTTVLPQYLLVQVGTDSANTTTLYGRHVTQYYSFTYGSWQSFANGSATITR